MNIEAVTRNEEGPKYFVLTFVLCGCIAGLVLAGIALYVLRRHARSKDKLAQITGAAGTSGQGGDGVNGQGEASKDYQVSLGARDRDRQTARQTGIAYRQTCR